MWKSQQTDDDVDDVDDQDHKYYTNSPIKYFLPIIFIMQIKF